MVKILINKDESKISIRIKNFKNLDYDLPYIRRFDFEILIVINR